MKKFFLILRWKFLYYGLRPLLLLSPGTTEETGTILTTFETFKYIDKTPLNLLETKQAQLPQCLVTSEMLQTPHHPCGPWLQLRRDNLTQTAPVPAVPARCRPWLPAAGTAAPAPHRASPLRARPAPLRARLTPLRARPAPHARAGSAAPPCVCSFFFNELATVVN